ncbi:hypothetical protein AK812_SmicGene35767 [Symbiodinium microadriaticum]|uniref:Reverse transcriptase domain-containing protein n=1 Tax=Symbiodinium microadriaticum TaxID=2951 RepID=A0A1Q9CKL7_SYMMI|nr:hypothetical protein AK812_SmicGene35767 [Symbiodinium microadriaticum]
MAAPQTAQEALRAWLNLLPPEERRAAQSAMGATLPASAQASHEPTHVAAPDEPTPTPSQADPSTTPIPEEPNPILLAQREWYDSQDKIFQGPIRPEPWQDDDLSAQPSSSASPQPTVNETSTAPQAPDQEPWLLPKPDTCLFNIFGESFELQARKEKIAKGQMPHCLFKDPAAVDQQPLNRQEMWAAMQYKPIYRTAGRWTYWDLLPDDIRKPPPPFCTEIEDAPKQPPASRLQPNKRDSRYQLTVPARPRMTSRADPATVYMPQPGQDLDIDQPGAFTQPYLFDISLLDRRAQPLYGHPHYKPIECMVFDKRPWICFYGGSPPTVVAETDEWWYTMYDREGGCCLQGWPMFLLQDFMRLFADPPPSPEAAQELIDDFKTNYPGPTTQELLAADRKIWGAIGTLVSAGWSLDEALYEEEGGFPGQEGNVAADTGVLPIEFAPPRCKALADPEAIPFLEPSQAPLEQESRLMLQCLWSRSIVAIIASLPAVARNEEIAISLMQAIKASAAIAILTVPRNHRLLRSPELAACLHDAAFHMCPSPRHGEVILASTKLPTWPCPDSELLALEALGRISKLPLRLGHITEISYTSLLKTSGPFVAHRPPICDGAGAPSSWIQWAQKSNLSRRVFAHISQSRPEHPLSQEEQSEALAILCSALNLDQASMATVSPGQPFRLELMQALAKLIEDPDQDLPSVLAEGVHTRVFSEIKPSGLWPPAKLQPLSQSGLEVCQGNWRPAEEDPETVAALLGEEEAAGGDYAYGPRSTQIISASSLLLFAFNGTLWRYVVCHFGATFSAYWWQRVGGLITRILHASLAQYPHRAWLYVDDLLAALLRTSAHESLLIIVLLLSCLGSPISWKKASVGDSLIWCGWKFNFAYETVELCAAKRLKLSSQIQGLLSKPKVQRKDLEACIGLLMWDRAPPAVGESYMTPASQSVMPPRSDEIESDGLIVSLFTRSRPAAVLPAGADGSADRRCNWL